MKRVLTAAGSIAVCLFQNSARCLGWAIAVALVWGALVAKLRADDPPNSATEDNARSALLRTAASSVRLSLGPLDLSKAPSDEELMAAGQLGGPLYPTHKLADSRREEAARLDLGKAIEQWNRHQYPKAVAMFRKHVADFPDSPWAAEAELHVGCAATYNGRYTEAEGIFRKLVADHQGKNDEDGRMMLAPSVSSVGRPT
jgi:TolA-binding protein